MTSSHRTSMSLLRRCVAGPQSAVFPLLLVFSIVLTAPVVYSAPVSAGTGVDFNQIDWAYNGALEFDSQWGVVTVDTTTLGGSGYINVHSSTGWIVQNLPVDPSSGITSLSTYFDLGTPGPIPNRQLDLSVEYTVTPLTDFLLGGAPNTFQLPATNQVAAAEGYGAGAATSIGLPPPAWTVPLLVGPVGPVTWQPGHSNVQTADNQCAPMAVANSLDWLNNTYPGANLGAIDPHVTGLGADGSLVGELEADMARPFVDRRNGTAIGATQILEGKFEYLDDNGLSNKLVTKFFDPGKDEVVGDFIAHNNTAHDQTTDDDSIADLVSWLFNEIASGEDVELGYFLAGGGGHFVELTGVGFILGVPFATFVHDADQTDDTAGLETGFTPLVDRNGDGFVDFNGLGNQLSFAISESIPAPLAGLQIVIGIAFLARRRR